MAWLATEGTGPTLTLLDAPAPVESLACRSIRQDVEVLTLEVGVVERIRTKVVVLVDVRGHA